MKTIRLREGKERSLLRRHPWVFQGSVARGAADAGETVRVESHDGRFLAWGAYSPQSMIRVRAWTFDEAERVDAALFQRRLQRAVALRARLAVPSSGMRLVHGEADGLPGLIVDRYGDTLCAQFLSAGAERWKPVLAEALLTATGLQRLYERSDPSVRKLEGLEPITGWLIGGEAESEAAVEAAVEVAVEVAYKAAFEVTPEVTTGAAAEVVPEVLAAIPKVSANRATQIQIQEHNWLLTVDIALGHKTGFYLDQRDNRALLSQWVRHFKLQRVLNCYSYTGGFSVAALAGGAQHVTSVDSSAPALANAQAHVLLNGFTPEQHTVADADVNQYLRARLAEGARFDAIVLDPPKFAPTVAHAERAARAYKDINRLALMLLAPGGLLMTFSCSGGISADLFHKIVAGAAADANVNAAILRRLEGAPDHPTTLEFPEGEYLKGLALLRE